MNHLAKATQIIILVLVPIALIKLLMESKAFLIVVMSLAFIVMLVALYEYNKGKL